MNNVTFIIYVQGNKVNLHDGSYLIDMGPGWVYGDSSDAVLASLLVPPKVGVDFSKLLKLETSKKITLSASGGLSWNVFTAQLTGALGREWSQEITVESTIEYPASELAKYIKIYAIADRYEVVNVKNGIVQDIGVSHKLTGIWGDVIEFYPDSTLNQNLLDENLNKTFIGNGLAKNVKLFKSSISNLPTYVMEYSNDEYSCTLEISSSLDNQYDVIAKIDTALSGIYKFDFSYGICDKVVVYKEVSGELLEYITSIDYFGEGDKFSIQLDLDDEENYYFRFINCFIPTINVIGKQLIKSNVEINNSYLDMSNRSIIELQINEGEVKSDNSIVIQNENNQFIGKETFYIISLPFNYDEVNKSLRFKAINSFYEIMVYDDEDRIISYRLKHTDVIIPLQNKIIIKIICKNIFDINSYLKIYIE